MKKWLFVLSAAVITFLGGCSFLNDVNNTLNYVDEATEYVNNASTFANDIPSLIEQAAGNEQARQELETKLEDMRKQLQEFNELEPPEMAADLHQQIENQNKKIKKGLDLFLNNIENGKIDPAILENSELIQSIQEVTTTLEQIKELGQ